MQRRNIRQRVVTDEEYWRRFREEVRPILEEIVEQTKPKWADRMMTVLDKAAGDYKKFDEEKTVLSGQVAEHTEKIDKLDERVQQIEKKFGFPQSF